MSSFLMLIAVGSRPRSLSMRLFAALVLAVGVTPRRLRVRGQRFVVASTNETIVLTGPNIVVKGPRTERNQSPRRQGRHLPKLTEYP